MHRITVFGRNTERKPLIAAVGFAFEIGADATQICIPGLVILIKANENNIVMGIAFIQPPGRDTVVDQLRVYATANKVIYCMCGTAACLRLWASLS